MKKIIIALLICALLVAVPFTSVSAKTCNSYIYSEGLDYSPGETLSLTFAADAGSVSGLSAEISVSDNLTIINAEGMLSGWDFEIANNTVVMYDIEGDAPVSGKTEFFELTVKVNVDSAPGDEISAYITAKLATVESGYQTVDTSTQFEVTLQECRHYETVWQVVTPPSGGNVGIKAEICTVCGVTLGNQEFSYLLGDIDFNAKVNVIDAVFVARYSSELITLSDEQIRCADVDGTGIAGILDAVLISRYSAGIISKFPAEQ